MNGAIIGIVSFIALVSIFWSLADVPSGGTVAFERVENRWGPVDGKTSEIRSVLTFHNPHRTQSELVRLEHEVLVNGARVDWESRNVSVRIPPESSRSVETAARFPNTFLNAWWQSHMRQGEETRVTIRGTATFTVLQKPVEVPYEHEATWSTALLPKLPQALGNCDRATPCIRSAAAEWGRTDSTLHVRFTIANTDANVFWVRNWTAHLKLHGVTLAWASPVAGPLELQPDTAQEVALVMRFDPAAWDDWWPRHVTSCELSQSELVVQHTREQWVNASYDANATQDSADNETEPTPGYRVADARTWFFPGPSLATGFVCERS